MSNPPATLQHIPSFAVYQRFAMTANRYEIRELTPDGSPGRMLGVAQQKRLVLKEEVIFYTDESQSGIAFGFRARAVMDLNAGYDISDGAGTPLGYFRKDFGQSLLRSTFHLEGAGYRGTGQERSQAVAIVRRFADIPFLPIHFDFVSSEGSPLLTVERQSTVRDRYTVTVPDARVDYRVAAAVAVAMDALMQR